MYTNPQNGQATAGTVAAPTNYRRALLDLLGGAAVITTAEYDAAVTNILACESTATLQKWLRNCIREIARREEAAAIPAPVQYATASQKEEIQKLANSVRISRPEKTRALLNLNRLNNEEAKQEIAQLWAKILVRATGADYPAPPADGYSLGVGADGNLSYSSAA